MTNTIKIINFSVKKPTISYKTTRNIIQAKIIKITSFLKNNAHLNLPLQKKHLSSIQIQISLIHSLSINFSIHKKIHKSKKSSKTSSLNASKNKNKSNLSKISFPHKRNRSKSHLFSHISPNP